MTSWKSIQAADDSSRNARNEREQLFGMVASRAAVPSFHSARGAAVRPGLGESCVIRVRFLLLVQARDASKPEVIKGVRVV